jgi:hypothetical protein
MIRHLIYIGDESLIFMTYLEILVVGHEQALTFDFEMKEMSMMHHFFEQEV